MEVEVVKKGEVSVAVETVKEGRLEGVARTEVLEKKVANLVGGKAVAARLAEVAARLAAAAGCSEEEAKVAKTEGLPRTKKRE